MRAFLTIFFILLTTQANAQLASANDHGITYGHVHLNVSDVTAHVSIWRDYFNGEVVQKGPLTAIKLPNMVILFTESAPSMGSRDTLMDHFGVKVRDIDAFLERWQATGLEAGRIFTGAEGQSNAYVTLPDGVYVELQEDQALHDEVTGYHVHFYSEDVESLLQWYADLLGSEIKPRGSISTTTNVPGMNLSFSNSRGPRQATRGAAIDHIGFEIENLEAFCEALEARGIKLDSPYREIPAIGLAIAFMTDPQGVRIEFTEGLVDY